jgi:hypothetical protein
VVKIERVKTVLEQKKKMDEAQQYLKDVVESGRATLSICTLRCVELA